MMTRRLTDTNGNGIAYRKWWRCLPIPLGVLGTAAVMLVGVVAFGIRADDRSLNNVTLIQGNADRIERVEERILDRLNSFEEKLNKVIGMVLARQK